MEAVNLLAEEMGKKLADAEQAGADGKVELSVKLMGEVILAVEIKQLCFLYHSIFF